MGRRRKREEKNRRRIREEEERKLVKVFKIKVYMETICIWITSKESMESLFV